MKIKDIITEGNAQFNVHPYGKPGKVIDTVTAGDAREAIIHVAKTHGISDTKTLGATQVFKRRSGHAKDYWNNSRDEQSGRSFTESAELFKFFEVDDDGVRIFVTNSANLDQSIPNMKRRSERSGNTIEVEQGGKLIGKITKAGFSKG